MHKVTLKRVQRLQFVKSETIAISINFKYILRLFLFSAKYDYQSKCCNGLKEKEPSYICTESKIFSMGTR